MAEACAVTTWTRLEAPYVEHCRSMLMLLLAARAFTQPGWFSVMAIVSAEKPSAGSTRQTGRCTCTGATSQRWPGQCMLCQRAGMDVWVDEAGGGWGVGQMQWLGGGVGGGLGGLVGGGAMERGCR